MAYQGCHRGRNSLSGKSNKLCTNTETRRYACHFLPEVLAIIGKSICLMNTNFSKYGHLLKETNRTHLPLIP